MSDQRENERREPVTDDAPSPGATLFSNEVYDRLKFVAQILLPAFATFYASFGAIWNFPQTEQVVGSIVAFDLFLGALLSLSSSKYQNNPDRFDGTMFVKKDVNVLGDTVLKTGYAVDLPAEVLEGKSEITFRVKEAPDDLLG